MERFYPAPLRGCRLGFGRATKHFLSDVIGYVVATFFTPAAAASLCLTRLESGLHALRHFVENTLGHSDARRYVSDLLRHLWTRRAYVKSEVHYQKPNARDFSLVFQSLFGRARAFFDEKYRDDNAPCKLHPREGWLPITEGAFFVYHLGYRGNLGVPDLRVIRSPGVCGGPPPFVSACLSVEDVQGWTLEVPDPANP